MGERMTTPGRERLLEAMDALLDVLRVGGALASAVGEQASVQFLLDGLERISAGLVAEGRPSVALELHELLLELAPPEYRVPCRRPER